ncbi:MAG TPA: BadF/BadG/BcrA/BcrD ATPase family protein [Steroidobacteraceae bacterium]|nr:BadF/BadG/BcrA/BcrD ATPase family protein [Steroidobacteraceae bacterium]
MRRYLGVDGGGSKTRFLLIDEAGGVLASHTEGSAYYLEIGLDGLTALLSRGIGSVLEQGRVRTQDVAFAFLGLPAYGEDRALLATLDAAPSAALGAGRYRCGNDMVCGWAGALAGEDGINVVAGTGSIAYGEYQGRHARAGGWGELFSDEGSAHWVAREGLRVFSRMSDGRTARGPLHALMRGHFALDCDLDICAAIYGKTAAQRSQVAQLSRLVAEAARAGDDEARALFGRAAEELAELVDAVRLALAVPGQRVLPVSCTGGMFELRELMREPLEAALAGRTRPYRLVPPRLPPEAGAALHAAKLGGVPLGAGAIGALERELDGAA